MATSKNVKQLVINKIENNEVLQYMIKNNLVKDDEIYIVENDQSVLYTKQSLTDAQKTQVRENIGAASIDDFKVVTLTSDGLMSSELLKKLNDIDDGATRTVVDSSLSTTSTNPVENKAITNWLSNNVKNYRLAIDNDKVYLTNTNINTIANEPDDSISDSSTTITRIEDSSGIIGYFSVSWENITGIPAADLSKSGIVQLTDSVSSSSIITAATPNSVKKAYDLANAAETKINAQAKLTEAKEYTDTKIDAIVGEGASETLDTIGEISIAVKDNKDILNTLNAAILNKSNKDHTHILTDILNTNTSFEFIDGDNLENLLLSIDSELYDLDSISEKMNISAGSATQPIYFVDGKPTPTTYTLGKSVPSNAKFTDTVFSLSVSDGSGNNDHVRSIPSGSTLTLQGTGINVTTGKDSDIIQLKLASHNHGAGDINSGTLSSDRLPTVPITKGGTGATTATGALTNLGITATANEINILDGASITTDELNYVDGVTSNIQGQLDGKSPISHSHIDATTTSSGFMSKTDKVKLNGIADSADSVSFSRSLQSGTKIGTITINGTGTDIYAPTDTDTHWTTGLKVSNSATGKTNVAANNGQVFLNVLDNSTIRDSHKIVGGGATTVTSDANGVITISSTDNNTTYSAATQTAAGLMIPADKIKLDGIDPKANAYSLPTASSTTLGGVKTTSTVTSTSGLTACPIIGGVPYYKDTNTTYNLGSFGITATAAELNFVDGVTSNIQTQLNNKSNGDHKHGADDITSGTLTVARGGTGITSNPSMLVNLGSTTAASVFATSPRPGITGTLPVANGGTGATTAANARTQLGAASASDLTSLTNRVSALESSIISVHSGTATPTSDTGEDGDLYLVTE